MTSTDQRGMRAREKLPADEICIGISACILGHEVRYDGGHKLDRFIRDTIGAFVRFVPVCPEVELGLGVPRETLQLVRSGDGEGADLRLIAPASESDRTRAMRDYACRKVDALQAEGICGFIARSGSPSCGMQRVPTYARDGTSPHADGRGLFTAILMERMPLLPVEEDGHLQDPQLCESFVERVFAHQRRQPP